MGLESGEKPVTRSFLMAVTKPRQSVLLGLRLLAFFATVSATIVMALNKETKSLVVATIGSVPVRATLTAKFQETPAFVMFVVVNSLASVHNLMMIVVGVVGHKFDNKGLRFVIVAILDMMTVATLSAGANAAAFMAELGKNGNSHARWNKICDNFDTFCDHGGGAILASFIGLGLMLIISIMSIITLQKQKLTNYNVVP